MNKDVISITPEDDITDVIAQIKASEKKIVALIPPQPAGILRSTVNIKLIAKVSEEAEKVPVLVTSDPAILKLAHEIRIPVADDLQSRPHIPTAEEIENISLSEDSKAEIAEDFVGPVHSAKKIVDEEGGEDEEEDEKPKKSANKKSKKDKKPGKLAQKFPWLSGKGKFIIIVAALIISIIGFLVWALVINASAEVYVMVLTDNENNFSEQATFIESDSVPETSSGIFQIKKESHDFRQRQNFTASGKKDIGDKATGELEVSIFFDVSAIEENIDAGELTTVKIPSGTTFTVKELNYVSIKEIIYTVDIDEIEEIEEICENGSKYSTLKKEGCQVKKTVPITASEPGEKYNQEDVHEDWTTSLRAPVVVDHYEILNEKEVSGGKSKIVTVVSQEDVDKIKANLSLVSETDGKKEFEESISSESSKIPFWDTLEIGEPTFEVNPAVGDEVKEGVVPVVVVIRPFSVYAVDKKKVEEFIQDNVSIPEDQKIYSYGEPFVEYFTKTETGYTGKIKTVYKTGPNITEDILFDKIAGRKVGEAQGQIRSISGIDTNSVKLDTSILVNTIPTDRNRVKITVDFKE